MKSPVLNVVIYEHIRERMWYGDEFSTIDIVDAVPVFHFFNEKNEVYNEEAVIELVNEIAQDMCEEFDFAWDEESEDGNFTYHHVIENKYKNKNDENFSKNDQNLETITRRADSRGRITIPMKFLKKMGWEEGKEIYMGIYGNEVAIVMDEDELEKAKNIFVLTPPKNGGCQFITTFNKLFDDVPDISYRTLDIDYDPNYNMIHIFVKSF